MTSNPYALHSLSTGLSQFVLAGVLSLSLAGCGQMKKGAGGNTDEVSSKPESARSGVQTELPGPCKKYVETFCEVVGIPSMYCVSIKTITSILPPSVCHKGIEDIAYTKNRYAEKRKVCTEMVEKLCNEYGPESRACAVVRRETVSRTPDDCRSMMKQYPEMVANLTRLEEVSKPLISKKQQMIAGGTANSFGPEDAKVTMVSFLDFQSPYSSQAAEVARQIKVKYGDKVRFVFRHFPDPFHQNAHQAAQASLAAGAQGKFWQYQDLLFENQEKLARSDLERYARKLRLNIKAFKKALDDEIYKEIVDADIEMGKLVYVSGTPTSYLNGKLLTNPTHFNLVAQEIDKALK
jgi:protein-disulfide isomerase